MSFVLPFVLSFVLSYVLPMLKMIIPRLW